MSLPLFESIPGALPETNEPAFRLDARTGYPVDHMGRPIFPEPTRADLPPAEFVYVLAAAVNLLDPAGRPRLYPHETGLYLIEEADAKRAIGWCVEMIGADSVRRADWYQPGRRDADPVGRCVNFGDDDAPEWYRVTGERIEFRPDRPMIFPPLDLTNEEADAMDEPDGPILRPAAWKRERVEISIALLPVVPGAPRETLCAVKVGDRSPEYVKGDAETDVIHAVPAPLAELIRRQIAGLAEEDAALGIGRGIEEQPTAWARERIELEITLLPPPESGPRMAQYSVGVGERIPYFARGEVREVAIARGLPYPAMLAMARALVALETEEAAARQAAAPARRRGGRLAKIAQTISQL